MRHLSEYRNPEIVKTYLDLIRKETTQPWTLMEICGGQTHGLVKNGLLDLLPKEITMIHGPGCPVCVTPVSVIDQAIRLATDEGVALCSFGDMLRVPGSQGSLLEAKAKGADVRIFYSPLEAVRYAKDHPEKEIVFFAVGFETTAPANALSVLQAKSYGLKNYSILNAHVRVPPAIKSIMEDEQTRIQGILGAGHVMAIMGAGEYLPICKKYHVPIVMTGFEPVDLVQGILQLVRLLERGEAKVENQYSRVIQTEGNPEAQRVMEEVFEISDREWRGIGEIPKSGYRLKAKYSTFDSGKKYGLKVLKTNTCETCIAGKILQGICKPYDCQHFGTQCTPSNPLGAPMVSSEGACSAYYQHSFTYQTL